MGAGSLPSGTVTLVFTDIEGSTKLLHEIGPAYGQVLAAHHAALRSVWDRFDGVEVDTEGDAFFIAFASPSRAVAAVTAAQEDLAGLDWPGGHRVRVRMGVHTGEPRERDGTYWGIDVHYAARLCSAAHGDQVLLSAATRALVPDAPVEDLGEHAVKDFPGRRHLFHLVVGGRRAATFPPPRTLDPAHTNLPTITTPLVGRESELADLERRVTEKGERLITLTGPGGSGKTRVAIACGAVLLDRFSDGVFLVALAPVPDAGGVADAVVAAIGASRVAELGPRAAAIEALREQRTLLVIDNFEHVLDAAPLIGDLLAAAPGLTVLVTSQAPLRLAAETVVAVQPLAFPAGGERDVERLATAPAVSLFVERARAADPSFALHPGNAASVARLCRELDGLPLAIELAAARVRMAGVDGLVTALSRGADALGRGRRDMPERQRGLRAALEWTVSLLTPEQRELLTGLAVFADAWTIEQAEEIFGVELDLWEAMAALIDFSLVRTRGDGRLSMAQRVRSHAGELLAGSGREPELRTRHAELMAALAERLTNELLVDVSATIAATRDAHEEIDQALSWTRDSDPALHRRLLGAIGRPYYFLARLPRLAPQIRALVESEDGRDAVSGRLFVTRAMVGFLTEGGAKAHEWTGRAVECHRRTADPVTLTRTMATHAHLLTLDWRGPESRACIREALSLVTPDDDPRVRDQLEGTIAFAALVEGEYAECEERLRVMLAHPERTDFAARAASSYLGDCCLMQGKSEEALANYASSLRDLRGIDENNAVLQMTGIACSLAQLGRDADAARLGGAVIAASARLGQRDISLLEQGLFTSPLTDARQRLGVDEWERFSREGEQLDTETAFDLALELASVGLPAN